MRKNYLLFPVCGIILTFAATARELIWEIDMTRNLSRQTYTRGKAGGYFRGVLPELVLDNHTAWSPAEVDTKLMNDKDGKYLRFNIKTPFPQYMISIPDDSRLKRGQYLLVEAEIRNQMNGWFHFNLRQIHYPWRERGEVIFGPGKKFQKVTRVIRLEADAPKEKNAYMIFFRGKGICDLKSLRLYTATRREAADHVSFTRIKPTSTSNFLKSDRFIEGLPNGWTVGGGGCVDSTKWRLTDDTTGPSGGRALEISRIWNNNNAKATLHTEAFGTFDLDKKICVSFSYKGKWTGTAQLVASWRELEKPVTMAPSEKWQRVKIIADYPAFERGAALRISGTGTVLLDGFCVSHDLSGEYKPANTNTISMVLKKGSLFQEDHFQFTEEKPILEYHISGDTHDAELHLQVTNVYEQTKTVEPIALNGRQAGEFRYDLFPDAPLGAFRVTARLFRNGKEIAPAAEYVVNRYEKPLYWGMDAPQSKFGIHCAATPSGLRISKATGFNWTRHHDGGGSELTGWYHLEPQPGLWVFKDDAIALTRANHMKILGGLSTAPEWASWKGFRKNTWNLGYFNRYWVPHDWDAWSHYVNVVVTRYKGVIDDWFVWNEPFAKTFFAADWKAGAIHPKNPHATYVKMLKTAYLTAKKANPQVTIVGFCGNAPSWADGVFKEGGYPYCDELDYHSYRGGKLGNPASDLTDPTSIRNLFKEIFKANNGKIVKPFIMSEGMGSDEYATLYDEHYSCGMHRNAIPWKVDETHWIARADRQVRYFLSHFYQGAHRVFLYHGNFNPNPTILKRFNALLDTDGKPMPASAAISALSRRVDDKTLVQTVSFGKGLYGYCFSNGTETVIAVTGAEDNTGELVYTGKDSIQIADLFGNPRKELKFCGRIMYISKKGPSEPLIRNLKAK